MAYFKFFVLLFLLCSRPSTCLGQQVTNWQERLKTSEGIDKISLLNELTTTYRKISLDSSILFARQAIKQAEQLKNDSLIADAHLRLCPSFYFAGLSDSTLLHATIAKKIGERLNAAEIIAYACQLIGTAHESKADFEKALTYQQQGLATYTAMEDLKGMGAMNQNISSLYLKTGELDLALEHAIAAEKIAEQTQRPTSRGLVALNIADIYHRIGQAEKQTQYLFKAKAIFTRDSFPIRHANVLEYIGNHHYEKQQMDSAIYYFAQSLAIHESLGNPRGIATAHGNLGSMYQEVKDWKNSYFHLHKALWMKQQIKNYYGAAFDLVNLGAHFDLQNQQDSAVYYYLESLKLASEKEITYVEEVALKQLVDFYERTGQYQLALKYHKDYLTLIEATKGVETTKKIASLEAQYESEKKERQIERLALESQVQASKSRALQVGILSLFFLSSLVIAGILYRRRNERKLNALQKQVHEKEKKELDQELIYKNKQLTSHALHMVQKNQVLQEIKQEIRALSESADSKNKKALHALIRRIDFDIQSDEDWNTFKLYFEETNQDFYTNLTKINKNLTTTELKLCSLIKLNMNIKETASVLNIEPTSVKTARHRLRKKLNLEQGQDLTSFIRQVA